MGGGFRRGKHKIAQVDLNKLERLALDEMKRRLGLSSDADAVRVGLFHLAKHAEIETYRDEKLFQIRNVRKPPEHRFNRPPTHWRAWGKRKVPKSSEYDLGSLVREPERSAAVPGADDPLPERSDPGSKTSS